jgi:pimeloyl-ACP methyl ester carboxylesterase
LAEINHAQAVERMEAVDERALIPGAEERKVTLDGVRWRYLHAGTGPPLLLIHGFLGYSFSWRFNIQQLSRYFSVYAIDLPGCGFSQRTSKPECSLAGDAEALLRFMEHLGIENANVVGSSRGGGLAILLAALCVKRAPLRLRRLILVSPINPWSSNGRMLTRVLGTSAGGVYLVHVQPRLTMLARRYFKALYGDVKRIVPGSFEGYSAGFNLPGSFEHVLRIVRSWHRDLADVEQSLPVIGNFPTLLLWGARDTAVYPSSIHQLQRYLKNSALIVLRGVGHLPYEEVPEDFNRIVCDFLLHNSPATPLEHSAQPPKVVQTHSQPSELSASGDPIGATSEAGMRTGSHAASPAPKYIPPTIQKP